MARQHGPWKIKESVQKYKCPWMEVYEDQVIQPDGNPGTFSVVKLKPGISVLPIDDDNNVYFAKEFQYAVGEYGLGVSSGAIESGEKPIDAAKRELVEELGIEADEWIELGKIHPFTSSVKAPVYLFAAKKLRFVKSSPESTEQISVVKMTFDEAVSQVMQSKIMHGASTVLVLKAKEYFRKQK